jgi:hypothetical protein
MPLQLEGFILFLTMRSRQRRRRSGFNRVAIGLQHSVVLTSEQVWEPYSKDFAEREEELLGLLSPCFQQQRRSPLQPKGNGEPAVDGMGFYDVSIEVIND